MAEAVFYFGFAAVCRNVVGRFCSDRVLQKAAVAAEGGGNVSHGTIAIVVI